MADDVAVKKAAPRKAPAKKTAAKRVPKPAPPLPPAGWYEVDTGHSRYWDGRDWLGAALPNHLVPTDIAPATVAPDGGERVPGGPAGTITFRGRVMPYRRPTADQLAVWKMVAQRAEAQAKDFAEPKPCPTCKGAGCDECQGTGSAHTGAVFKLFNRAMTIINSVLVDETDKDWLEDELIAGRVELRDAAGLVNLTVQQLIDSQPDEAPKHGPAPKARRRR